MRTTLELGGRKTCAHCGLFAHEHDRERVYPDDGPAGTYHYRYVCPPDAKGISLPGVGK